MAKELRWHGLTLRRRQITWASGGEDSKGRTPPRLTRADARRLLEGIAGGMDARVLADKYGLAGISVDYRRSVFDHRGRRSSEARWNISVFIDLNPCMDASRFRGPLTGLPADAFKGF